MGSDKSFSLSAVISAAVLILGSALSLGVASVGCADANGRGTAADLGAKRDLSQPQQSPDLATRRDLAVSQDLGADDLGQSNCTQVATWPGLLSAGRFESSGPVTLGGSQAQSTEPYDLLLFEDWHLSAGSYPKSVTLAATDTYQTCDLCVALASNVMNDAGEAFYFAQGGSLTVTQSDTNPLAGSFKLSASNLKLVEWDLDFDEAVTNGKCWEIGTASLDVSWSAPLDGGAPMDAGAADMALGCAPKINELMATGPAADGGSGATEEFVELFNPCPASIDLTGWKLVYRSAGNNSGGADVVLHTFSGLSIASMGYTLIGGKGYTLPKDATILGGGLAGGGGAVGLRNPAGVRVDSVSYLTLSGPNDLTETAPALNPPQGKSIARSPNGVDTDNNAADFTVMDTPTPKAAN